MSSNAEETIPVVMLWPYDSVLGELLGGINVLDEGNYEFTPAHDEWFKWILPPSYKITTSGQGSAICLRTDCSCGGGFFESHTICMETHGNWGTALMKMTNIAYDAIKCRDNPPTGQIKKWPNQDIMIPFWMVEVRGAVSEVVRSICVVFPDDYGSGSFYEMVCRLRSQRDHAFDSSIRAAHGIAASNIKDAAKG